jgi:lysyl-tRNA synthetase class 2
MGNQRHNAEEEGGLLSTEPQQILRLVELGDLSAGSRFRTTARLHIEERALSLCDWSAQIRAANTSALEGVEHGWLIEIDGVWDGRLIHVQEALRIQSSHVPAQDMSALARSGGPERAFLDPSWVDRLRLRTALLRATRAFFDDAGFEEVEVPCLVAEPGVDPHIRLFKTDYEPLAGAGQPSVRYLHTSPELAMKRYLVSGAKAIYRLGPVFRNGECDDSHAPEFTMVEWYRVGASLDDLMREVEGLVSHLFQRAKVLGWNPPGDALPFQRRTIRSCFLECVGVDPLKSFDPEIFACDLSERGLGPFPEGSSYAQIFYQAMVEKIEDWICGKGSCFVTGFPAPLALLSRLDPGDPRQALRVEAYLAKQELANGFEELTCPTEQRRRFDQDLEKRRADGQPLPPLPEDFLTSLGCGLPPTSGIALGIDRLIQVITGNQSLKEVLPFTGQFAPRDDA